MDIFSTIFKSFYSVDAYKNAALNWRWKILFYFLIITVISSLVSSIVIERAFDKFYTNSLVPAFEQLRDIKIENGNVITPNNQNIILKSATGQKFGIVSNNYLDAMEVKDIMFAIEKDRVSIYQNGDETSYKLKDFDLENASGKDFSESLPFLKKVATLAIPLISLALSILSNIIYIALLSLAAFILSLTMLPRLGIARSIKIATLSITPPIIINIGLILLGIQMMPDFLYALISGGLIWFVITGIAKQEFLKAKKDLP